MRIEFRAAVLISLLTLLWLSIEYAIGLQDRFIAIYPFVTLLSIVIPVYCYRKAFTEKSMQLHGNLNFKQGFISGLGITFFTSLLCILVQIAFVKGINPDFISTMLDHAVSDAHQRPEVAAAFINTQAYVIGSVLLTFVSGLFITLILSAVMRTPK